MNSATQGPEEVVRALPVLECRNVTKRYKSVVALDSVSLILRPGQVTALVGENGAGKSTLSGIVAGIVKPDGGQLVMDGSEISFDNPAAAHDAGVRISPQELTLCDELSVAENVLMGALPAARGIVNRQLLFAGAEERLKTLGVTDLDVRRRVSSLSLVEKTFVQISRALLPGVRVLVVDEPTAAMGASEADRFISAIRTITDSGVATIYVSHHLDEVARVADVAIVLRDGRRSAELEAGEITHDRLIKAMVGNRSLAIERPTPETGEVRLKVRGLTSTTLSDFSLTVRAGEIVGIYGIAGSGREEVGASMVGLRESSGEVSAGAGESRITTIQDAIANGIGYVPPERRSQGLVLGRSIGENVALGRFRSLSRRGVLRDADVRRHATPWITQLAIATPSPDKEVGLLSGGSQQKVLLARWLAAGSQTLVLEEPTRGVDVGTKAEIHRLLRDTANQGGAVVVITSDIEEVVDVSDRVMVLRHGRTVEEFVSPTIAQVASAALITEVQASDQFAAPGTTGEFDDDAN